MPDSNKYHNGQYSGNGLSGSESFMLGEKNAQPTDDEIDLKQLFYTLWNRKWLIACSIILCGLLGGLIALASTPIYQSQASILISQSQNKLTSLGLSGGGALSEIVSNSFGIGAGSTLGNELQVLRSRKLSLDIADTLMEERIMPNGRQYPVLFKKYPDDSAMTSQDTVAARLRGKLTFEKVEPNADVIGIFYESPSPLEASHIINMTIAQYENLSNRQNRTSANSAVGFLEKEQARIKKNLKQTEEDLREFMDNNKLVQVDAQTKELITQMANLEARRQEARAQLVAANSAVEQYKDELNSIKPGLAEQYAEAVGPDIERFQYAKSELELQKQQLLTQNPNLSETSPQITKLNQQIESYKKRIKELTQSIIDENDRYLGLLGGDQGGVAQSISDINQKLIGLQVQQKQYQAQIDVITEQLNKQQQFFNNLPDNIIDLARLKRDVKINEEMYLAVTKQYAETTLWEQSQFGPSRIIDSGYVPKEPVYPSTLLFILVGLILGGILGTGFVFFGEVFNTTIKGVDTLKKYGKPVLAVIPSLENYIDEQLGGKDQVEVEGKDISTRLVTYWNPDSIISESFRRLENNLLYADSKLNQKSILVTSSTKGEGKTTVIANLGVVLSEAGFNTLLVDADFRQPNLHNLFGLKATPGITDIILNEESLKKGIQKTRLPNLSLISTGRALSNMATVSRDRRFLEILDQVEQQFDFVLIDTAPFGIAGDAAPILKQVSDVVVVAKFGKTSTIQLQQIYEQLRNLNVESTGTVLTAYDTNKTSDVHFDYANYYAIYENKVKT